ncbi:hypothetical protein C8R44DRAFT_807885 [Mycena epipterygia]|nr:hypothetical protein C8R44DRAFT_807885 [Mycena epipterygia]
MADDATDNPGPIPLQDSTNTSPNQLAAMMKEIESLRGLVNGLTKKRGRGRKRARENDAENDEQDTTRTQKKKSKADPATDYVEYGRVIGRFLGPFVNIAKVVNYGITMDAAMSGDEGETDERLATAWKILWQKFPGFHEYLLSLSTEPVILRAVVAQITAGVEAVRQQDTSTVKAGTPRWLHKDPATPLDPPLINLKSKTHRGQAHPTFAQRLTPMEWAANESTYQDIVEGKKLPTGAHLPGFVFPLDQVFPVGVSLNDPIWLDVLSNALKGEIPLRAGKAIFMGPSADLEGDGYHKGRPGNAKIIGLVTFTPRVIAWVVTQVYFALSSKQEWGKKDGEHFDYEEFFWTIHDLFGDDEEWAKEIIAFWDRVVLGTVSQATTAAESGPSTLAQLKAARAAAKHAAAAPSTAATTAV